MPGFNEMNSNLLITLLKIQTSFSEYLVSVVGEESMFNNLLLAFNYKDIQKCALQVFFQTVDMEKK
jgi:hypothetical protein